MYHKPVLLKESIQGLNIQPEGIYADVTFGGGGHAREILKHLTTGRLIAFDQDQDALSNSPDNERFLLINQNFRYLKNFLYFHGIKEINGLLADLGISSYQIDQPHRGFSIRFHGNLDLRMDSRKELTGSEVINTWSVEDLTRIFREYGEIKQAHGLARAIVEQRSIHPVRTTDDLKSAIIKYLPRGKENKYMARVFQAIRIEVNEELDALKEMLSQAAEMLIPGGRLVVISYHSLEDRLVKNFIRAGNFEGKLEKDFFGNPLLKFKQISRKPIIPDAVEISNNPRARSAKLRIAEKI